MLMYISVTDMVLTSLKIPLFIFEICYTFNIYFILFNRNQGKNNNNVRSWRGRNPSTLSSYRHYRYLINLDGPIGTMCVTVLPLAEEDTDAHSSVHRGQYLSYPLNAPFTR